MQTILHDIRRIEIKIEMYKSQGMANLSPLSSAIASLPQQMRLA